MFYNGDCLSILNTFDSESIDLIVTDPPYGIAFMGKDWDKALPSPKVWKECFRVLKEGKMAFIMCSPRQDVLSRMIISLEQAGFRTNYTSIYWSYASGFPKAKNNKDGSYVGFQPKPAVEVILVVSKGKSLTWLDDCRIPYSSDSDIGDPNRYLGYNTLPPSKGWNDNKMVNNTPIGQKGRFPANLLVSDDVLNDGAERKAHINNPRGLNKSNASGLFAGPNRKGRGYINYENSYGDSGSYSRYFDLDKWYSQQPKVRTRIRSTGDKYQKRQTDKPFEAIDTYPDSGPAITANLYPFIITPKASKSERNKGLENLEKRDKYPDGSNSLECFSKHPDISKHGNPSQNHHPTVKPLKLMSYLITMGSREGDLVLDPFMGSGSTCLAAEIIHREWTGIELDPEYLKIAQSRMKILTDQLKLDSFFQNEPLSIEMLEEKLAV